MERTKLLHQKPLYSTQFGSVYVGDALCLMQDLPENSVNLVLTSPPYALHFKKEYGNKNQSEYVLVPAIRQGVFQNPERGWERGH